MTLREVTDAETEAIETGAKSSQLPACARILHDLVVLLVLCPIINTLCLHNFALKAHTSPLRPS